MATTQNPTKPISSFLPSPRFFNGFFMTKNLHDQQSSPTSILDTKQLFTNSEINPFRFTKNPSKPRKSYEEIQNPFEKFESESENGIALALAQENPKDTIFKPNAVSRKILFGSNLKIQIPSYPLSDPFQNGSPEQSCDFGIKTRNLQFSGHLTRTGSGSTQTSMDALSLSEMELSEEYTRVVSYGSNPKTTHIYDNCVVETDPKSPYQNFLSFCHTCKKNLDDNCDIFMYRGEKAFCSEECRCEEMVLDGLMKSDQPS